MWCVATRVFQNTHPDTKIRVLRINRHTALFNVFDIPLNPHLSFRLHCVPSGPATTTKLFQICLVLVILFFWSSTSYPFCFMNREWGSCSGWSICHLKASQRSSTLCCNMAATPPDSASTGSIRYDAVGRDDASHISLSFRTSLSRTGVET